jgi:hypothetical protein
VTEEELKAEARLMAMGYMITNAYVLLHRANRSTPQQVEDATVRPAGCFPK